MEELKPRKDSSIITKEEINSILALPGKNRIEKILDSPHPAALVAKIPEIEIFLTIKEVGEQDALDLISLTTPEQLTYLLDLDLWDKDQILPDRFLFWLEILEQCGTNKLRQFFRTADIEFLGSAFRKVLRVHQSPYPEEAPEEKKGAPLFSLDQIYYLEFLEEKNAPLLMRLFHFLYASLPDVYQALMEQIFWGIPAEDEELALRWRNGRLADQGFPNFDEALEIYSYFPPEKIKRSRFFVLPKLEESFHPPMYLEVASKGTFLGLTLQNDLPEETKERIKWELTGLINRVLIADGSHLGDVEALYQSARKALQTLDLGLKYLSQENPAEARQLLEKIPLTRIFQAGFSLTLDLKRKAQELMQKGWLANIPRRADILDSPLKETIKGLLRKRPLFFNENTGNFTPFAALTEISLTADRLDKISCLGEIILELFGISVDELSNIEKEPCFFTDPPLSTICLTFLAQGFLHGSSKLAPLTILELNKIYEKLNQNGLLTAQTLGEELIKKNMALSLLKLEGRKKEVLFWWLEFLQNKLHSSLGQIRSGDMLDPRAIDVFLVYCPS
ncbi:MAG: DUF6178 family protein [Thermodesulfobacteriota bacterium]